MKPPLLVAAVVALVAPMSGSAKGFTRATLVGSNGRSLELRAPERVMEALLAARGAMQPLGGGYVRLFFVGPAGFPAAPARYYPQSECVALDWPAYETTCRRITPTLVHLLPPARVLPRFRVRPTVLAGITFHGTFRGLIKTAAALEPAVELALDRTSRFAPLPKGCYAFSSRWRGPAAHARPRRFLLCPTGVYKGRRLYPLERGVWAWFHLNVD
jgi:hypothetical protein